MPVKVDRMAFRIRDAFIEPQNTEQGMMNVEVRNSEKHFLLLHSLFDIRYSNLAQ
jgi:hypothetical protein